MVATEQTRKWLDGLKVGDEVCIRYSHSAKLGIVTHATKTQVVIDHNLRMRRTNGYMVGSSMMRTHIIPIDDYAREKIALYEAKCLIALNLHSNQLRVSNEAILKIGEIIKADIEKKETSQ
jgi:hypothetical protein